MIIDDHEVQLQSKSNDFTVKEVMNKMKALTLKCKMEKDKRKSGNATAKKKTQWKYFSKIRKGYVAISNAWPCSTYIKNEW